MKNKYISKIAAAALTLALILISVIPSFAVKTVNVKVEIAGSDGLVYVRLTAPASSSISTFSAPLKYDTTKLEFKEMSFLTDNSIINSVNSGTAGVVIANTVIAESLTEESKIFTYVFKVLDGAEGECEFSFDSVTATDSANKEINIVFDGALTASLSSLEPLTPDKVQASFEPAAAESQPENNKENQDKPNIPNTTRKVAAISAASVVAAAAIAASAVAIKKKKENE